MSGKEQKEGNGQEKELSEIASNAELSEQEKAIAELIQASEDQPQAEETAKTEGGEAEAQLPAKKERIFQKYKIKDIVFLAIITACTLVTGAVMPFVSGVPMFGIIQLCLGLQFSILPVIGMMKVRKPGALLFQSVLISIFLVFMFPPMVSIIACAFIAEFLVLIFFRGYKNDWACVLAGTLYMPLTIPMLFMIYAINPSVGKGKAAETMFVVGQANTWMIVGITVAVIAVCFVGSVVGMVIARELKKSGKLKQ